MVAGDAPLIAFVVAVTNFFNSRNAYQLVLSMHGEPWTR
jgi:hypothetical protein